MTTSEWLQLGIACAWLSLAVTLVRTRRNDYVVNRWLAVGVLFCLLRAIDFLFVQALDVNVAWLLWPMDALVLLVLIALIFGTTKLRRGLERQHIQAEHAEAEYGRALLDYTQLVRHRIANPLTAVIVGTQTLLDLDLEPKVRRQILEAMLNSAEQLQRVALHPEQVSSEELELEPRPAPLDDDDARDTLVHEAGQVEADFRDVNRQLIEVLPDDHVREAAFVCECSARDCSVPVIMTLNDYYSIHADGAQFVIAPEHNLPSVEDVVMKEATWWVVKKRGRAGRRARERD